MAAEQAEKAPEQQPRVLVVLPESAEAKELVAYLNSRGFVTMWAHDGESAYEVLDTDQVHAMICAVGAPRTDALRLQHLARQRHPQICSIVLADPSAEQISLATEAVRGGAYDYQVRPLNTDRIGAVLDRGLSYQRLMGEVTDLQKRLDERFRLGTIARRSAAWQPIYRQVE